MKFNSSMAAVLAGSLLLSSCAQTGGTPSKTQKGAGIGAIAGAILGASVSDDKKKGAVLGALLGGIAGAGIGRFLDEKDKQRLATSTEQTIVTGNAQSWNNPETGVSAQTQVKETVAQTEQRSIPVLKDRVQQVPPLEFIGEDYVAAGNANVRGGPGTDYAVVSKLSQGATTRVVGKVQDKNWFMISENNIGSGFVSADLLKPAGIAMIAPPAVAPMAVPPANVEQASVAATSTCRVVTQQVTLKNGQTESQDVKACRGPNGWEIMSA